MQTSRLRRRQVLPRSCTLLSSWPQTLSGSFSSNRPKAASSGFNALGTVTSCNEERSSRETFQQLRARLSSKWGPCAGHTWQSSLHVGGKQQTSFSPGCQQGCVGTTVVTLELPCSLLRGHQCLQREKSSCGAKGLEQRCAESQAVTKTCLMLLRNHLENAATAQ